FAGKKSAQIREILISESAWEEMTCLFAPSLNDILNAREHIKGMLKDPSSAKFSGEFIGKNDAICGHINAKNSFGGYTGESRYIFSVNFSAIDEGTTSFNKEWERQCYLN
ncbi:hypothetical protein L1Q87_25510, partial [Klebsiella pneumoniae]